LGGGRGSLRILTVVEECLRFSGRGGLEGQSDLFLQDLQCLGLKACAVLFAGIETPKTFSSFLMRKQDNFQKGETKGMLY
jgi:hypothetical protein